MPLSLVYVQSMSKVRRACPPSGACHQLWVGFRASRYHRADSTTCVRNQCMYSVIPHCMIIWSRKKMVQIPLRVAVVPKSYGPAIIYDPARFSNTPLARQVYVPNHCPSRRKCSTPKHVHLQRVLAWASRCPSPLFAS